MGRKNHNKDHRMISISKELNERLRKEPDASYLIEELLTKHYELFDEQELTSEEKIKKWAIEKERLILENEMKVRFEQRKKEIESNGY